MALMRVSIAEQITNNIVCQICLLLRYFLFDLVRLLLFQIDF
jgi:hypothetical protein